MLHRVTASTYSGQHDFTLLKLFKGDASDSAKKVDTFNRLLVQEAYESSLDPRKDTPYSRSASDYFDLVYSGGKQDDILSVALLCLNESKANKVP